jgi:hypothetical protein
MFLFFAIFSGVKAYAGMPKGDLTFKQQQTHHHHHRFDLKPSHFFLHLPTSLLEDIPEDFTEDQFALILRAHADRHKRRYYISTASQQYSFTNRLQQLQLLLVQYIPGNEKKTGIYQWHDAFKPAYYKFLFRYTLF